MTGEYMISASATYVRFFLLVVMSAAAVKGAVKDITIPLDNGTLVLHNPSFRGSDNFAPTGKQLLLSFVLENHTSSSWNNIDLEFRMGGFCNGESREWSYVFHGGFLVSGTSPAKMQVQETVGPLPGKNMECDAEIIKARLIFGMLCDNPLCVGNGQHRVEGRSAEPLDVGKDLEPLRAKREAEAEELARQRGTQAAEEKRRNEQLAIAKAEALWKAAEEGRRATEEQAKRNADAAKAIAEMIRAAPRTNLRVLTMELRAKGGSREKDEF
jgi:hypothetical protein